MKSQFLLYLFLIPSFIYAQAPNDDCNTLIDLGVAPFCPENVFFNNIDATESDLTTVDSRELQAELRPVRVQWRYADESSTSDWMRGDLPPNLALMGLIILLLIGEQALAYSASYHPARGGEKTV